MTSFARDLSTAPAPHPYRGNGFWGYGVFCAGVVALLVVMQMGIGQLRGGPREEAFNGFSYENTSLAAHYR